MAFAPVTYQATVDTLGNPTSPTTTVAVAVAAATTTVKAAPGRIATATVTTAGTSGQNAVIYDNATAGSGTILAVIPGGGTVGAIITINMPAALGITVTNSGTGPAFTLAFS